MENKLKHLEFIENVITRMNTNSFVIKGWLITLISVLFVLATKDTSKSYVLITYVPLPMFWILDGFFLSKERQYCTLYKEVTTLDVKNIDFDMTTKKFNTGRNTWLASIFSPTLAIFYGILFILTLVVIFII